MRRVDIYQLRTMSDLLLCTLETKLLDTRREHGCLDYSHDRIITYSHMLDYSNTLILNILRYNGNLEGLRLTYSDTHVLNCFNRYCLCFLNTCSNILHFIYLWSRVHCKRSLDVRPSSCNISLPLILLWHVSTLHPVFYQTQ